MMIDYSMSNAPLQKELTAGRIYKGSQLIWSCRIFHSSINDLQSCADEIGHTAAFLASPLASAITGAVIYVDNGLNTMGVGVDSPVFKNLEIPTDQE